MTAPLNQSTARFSYGTKDELVAKLGYVVAKAAPEQITMGELARRVGRPVSTVSRSLTRPTCPPFQAIRGKRRILKIEPNAKLIAYLTTPPTGGRPARI